MADDLNHAVLGGKNTRMPYLALVDGIIAGEGEGPLSPVAIAAGSLTFGDDPWSVDAALAIQMGFRPESIPSTSDVDLETVIHLFAADQRDRSLVLRDLPRPPIRAFRPHHGWRALASAEEGAG